MPYFRAFSALRATVAFFMNSITLVMNFSFSYFNISIDFVQLELFFSTFLFRNLQLNTSLNPDVSFETSAYSWLTY